MNDKKSYKDLGGMFAWHVKNAKPMTGSEMPTHSTDIAQLSGSPSKWEIERLSVDEIISRSRAELSDEEIALIKNGVCKPKMLGRVRDWFKRKLKSLKDYIFQPHCP